MAVVYVNDRPIDIGSERLNLIQAAQKAGVLIPHYCWHPALSVVASCRMCLVEVGERKPDGTVVMQPKVVPACQTPAKDGTVVVTNSERARYAQQQTLESLLLNHPLDCPVCDKAGECLLQDYSYRFGRAHSRLVDDKNQPPNKPYIGEQITLFTDRCIMCTRCVRFTREISGTAELEVVHRGHHAEIDIFPGRPCNNKLAGNVVDLCPVGALCSKDFLYKQRVWFLKSQASVCADCSTGCSVFIDSNKDVVYRLRPRSNPLAQGDFMCDEGRFGYHYINARERWTRPLARGPSGLSPADWPSLLATLRRELRAAAQRRSWAVVAMLSPFLTCEEAFLLAKYFKGLSEQVRLVLGPVPIVGEDDTYPKDARGRPVQPVKFTIRAEKCPNRRGVEEVLRHFQGEVVTFDVALRRADEGQVEVMYLAAGYPPRPHGWITPEQGAVLAKVPRLIVHDLWDSPAAQAATWFLPAASVAEKEGTFVNHAGLAQAVRRAIRPPGECRADGQVFWELLERRGLFHAPAVRAELAREVAFFAPLGSADLGEHGMQLPGAPAAGADSTTPGGAPT
ncbi:MAG: 2Fe-2S iron-sulfur cluster-binding protein [Gemmataceae bacterium]|nr:2Fe-2S iron-sulfur cluster-binding protein [Gemmataceae bacterium]MDW8267339.1 2Fe-2S iron-sulfur cluster-binding protein [Gemmataceae bacterium]